MGSKGDLYATLSDMAVLQEKGYTLGKLIGEGSYAKVYKTTQMLDETRTCVLACKVIDTSKAPRDYLTKFLPREMDALIRLSHPHLVHVSSIFQRRAKYFVFLRFAENGDLLDFLTHKGAVGEAQARLWMRQIFLAIEYVHTLNFAHRDLKCENVLITANYNVKITDFGFARYVKQRERDVMSDTYCGSLSYAAPEVLKGIPYLPKCSDIWSVGVIMYTMLNKALPFTETSVRKLYEKQLARKWKFRSAVVNSLSAECKRQVTDMLEPEASERPPASALAAGVWIHMDVTFAKMTFLEESLLKRAKEEGARRMDVNEESESERLADLRRKQRGKEMTFLEESLLKRAKEGARRMDVNEESESERLADLRRKQRGKDGLKILKATDINANKSSQLFKE